MNATALKRLRVNGSRPRRRHDPLLVSNMSIFNSEKIRQCIFNSRPQRENVWS